DLLAWLRAPGLITGPRGEGVGPELADGLEARARRAGAASATAARALWEQRHWPLETIDHLRAAQARGPRALIDRVARELGWLFSAARRRQAGGLGSDEMDEARALAAGRRALAELAELARVAPELAPGDAGELAEILRGVELLAGEMPGPERVAVLDPLALRARRVRALFVCRLQEGVFPAPGSPPPFLAEEHRRGVSPLPGVGGARRAGRLPG